MPTSVFDIFQVGLGPSSSHTVGPMRAARDFALKLSASGRLKQTVRLTIELFGSLGLTGRGHGTDRALCGGLLGLSCDAVMPEQLAQAALEIRRSRLLNLPDGHRLDFDPERDIVFFKDRVLPLHSNGMRFSAYGSEGRLMLQLVYYSIGGGMVLDEHDAPLRAAGGPASPPHPFVTAAQLLEHCAAAQCGISHVIMANECAARTAEAVRTGLHSIWQDMKRCMDRGMRQEGRLPGLGLTRRAPALYRALQANIMRGETSPLQVMDWISIYAIAIGEENAAGGQVVTAPTNGAAGIVPAVLRYYTDHVAAAQEDRVEDFLLTAGAVGLLYRMGASISGAEVGCQGEVGVACSMAAAGLAAAQGGTPKQVENAAEIAMEHNLGLTCDPVGGFVQIPCIERNAVGAVKAVNAARLALLADGTHLISLDKAIAAMKRTGADMAMQYKETSLGGLAATVALPEC